MNQKNELDIVWGCSNAAHQHPTWEGAEKCLLQADPQVAQLQMAVTKLALSCMKALDALRLLLPPDHQRLKETYQTIHNQLTAQYQSAGEPYGQGEEAMWRWLKDRVDI